MSDDRHGSHTTFSIHLQSVWITKERHTVWRGEVAERVRAIVRAECQQARVESLPGPSAPDPVQGMLSMPPHGTLRRLVQRRQGPSASRRLAALPQMRTRLWGRHVGARGDCCRRGPGTDEVIKASMAQPSHASEDVLRSEGEAAPPGATP